MSLYNVDKYNHEITFTSMIVLSTLFKLCSVSAYGLCGYFSKIQMTHVYLKFHRRYWNVEF